MLVISEDADAFADAKQEEKTQKTETFDDPMSMINENGYVEIPISDLEHLKAIVITGDVKSSAGSSWATAGCAVCINAVTPDGTKFWTSKGYSLKLGTGSKATVEFDGTLQTEDKEDVAAVVADGKIELQKWWDASEKQESDLEDTITADYTKVEVIYEYTGGETAPETTEPEKDETLWGDADCSKLVDVSDAVLIARLAAEDSTAKITAQGKKNADVTHDGNLSTDDSLLILKYICKIITEKDLAPKQ